MNKGFRKGILLEDVSVGVGDDIQVRNGTEYKGTLLNASGLLGMLVVKSYSDLTGLDITKLEAKSVYVQDDLAIYTYNSTTQSWVTDYQNMRIINSTEELLSIPTGYRLAYNMQDGLLYYKDGQQPWLANSSTIYIVENNQDLGTIPDGVSMAIIKTTGQLYHRTQTNQWAQIAFDSEGDPIIIVDTLASLPSNPAIHTALVRDADTGGIFVYDANEVSNNDGGLNINGWLRQYHGDISVKWFGAKGDGITDDTEAFNKAFAHMNVVVPAGEYLCTNPLYINKDINIIATGAILKFTNSGSIQAIGTVTDTHFVVGALTQGATEIAVDNRDFVVNGYVQITDDTNSFGKHSRRCSQIAKVLSKTGSLSLALYSSLQHSFTNATVRRLDTIKVNIVGLSITSESNLVPLTLGVVSNSTLMNCSITSSTTNALNISSSVMLKLLNVTLTANGNGQVYSMLIKDSDNIAIDASVLYGKGSAIRLDQDQGICNNIGVYKSTLMAGTNAIDSNGCSNNLHIADSEITGVLQLGGRSNTLTDCTVTTDGPAIRFKYLVGGKVNISGCSFNGKATSILDMFITHSSSNVLNADFSNISEPVFYSIENCNFNDITGKYLGIAEGLGIAATATAAAIESTFHMSNLTYSGLTTAFANMFRLGGPFKSISIIDCNSGAFPLCSVREIYDNNTSLLASYLTKYCNTKSFYTNMTYTANATYGYDISDNITANMNNKGYRILVDAKAQLLRNLTIHGKDLDYAQNDDEITMDGTVTKKAVDKKFCLEVYLGNTSGIPATQIIANQVMRLAGPIVITDKKIDNGVI